MSSLLKGLKNVSAEDRRMIEDAELMLGPEPTDMGFIKNLFWNRFREDLIFPYPKETPEEKAKCDALLAELDDYLANEHPSVQIDQEEEIPQWCLDRLFEIGVMGMTIPEAYGGLGLGVTSYNRALSRIGAACAGTAVVVSAHQSIGCKALMLFGNEEQKRQYLPKVAREYLSAFCLSEPNVGCDAAGQETECELSKDGTHYILNGEKKWSTSGALAGLFTVMAKQTITDPKTGKTRRAVTALICTPDMEGVDVFEKNRSKCGIRGTWQARIRFTNVKVPVANRLHKEGKGLNVALTCLNYGRCTLSAGMLGAAAKTMDQGIKWARTRYQFGRPLSDFDLVKKRIAHMAALTYAMDAMLYMMTGMLDRHDDDIMVETAATKVFCSEMGWRVINDAVQIMGGDGYMTENGVERAFRDSRIYLIVEGANEVMQSFIFAYGGKQLAEQMLGVQTALFWDGQEGFGQNMGRMLKNAFRPAVLKRAIPLGMQLILGKKPAAPRINGGHASLQPQVRRLEKLIRDHAHAFKTASMANKEHIVTRQTIQARIADNAMYLFAISCVLSKLTHQIEQGESGPAFERDRTAALHFIDIAELAIKEHIRALDENEDASMRIAAEAAIVHNDTLPNEWFIIHEKSPVAAGTGRAPDRAFIKQFPGDAYADLGGDGHPSDVVVDQTTPSAS